jgi:hypothetical protein
MASGAAMKLIALSTAVLVAAIGFARAADLPTPELTPGQLRDGITTGDLCPTAHTSAVRNVPASLKKEVYRRYGLTANHAGYCTGIQGCEVDHLCSLEIGGSNDITNLWPQSYDTAPWNAHVKDRLENEVHRLMCVGELTPQQACDALAKDWIASHRKYLGEP